MSNPPLSDEQLRLQALKDYDVLDSLPEKQFDDITRLASIICDTPVTLISLIDKDRQWFKSKIGIDDNETPLDVSFCKHAILEHDVFEVPNSLKDERFANNPFVTGEANIRFYAGAPLETPEGINIGTLCVLDTKPKTLTEEQKEALRILANEVITNLELRRERRKIAAEKLVALQSNELLHAFFDNSPFNISMKDTNGHFTYANTNVLNLLNKKLEDIVGRGNEAILPASVAATATAYEKEVVQTKKTLIREYEIENNGRESAYSTYIFPLLNEHNEVYATGTITNNITQAKAVERELHKSKERFMGIFRNSPVGMVITSVSERRYINVNETFLNIFEFNSEDEVLGKNSQELHLVAPAERDRITAMIEKYGSYAYEEIHCLTRTGKSITVLGSVNRIEMSGETLFLTSFVDITERKKMEIQLAEAKHEAEQANHSKSSFLANMSHEIRTPLNAMLGFADLLERTQLTAQQKDYLQAIDTSGKNLLTIINDILDFSKIEAGMLSIEKVPFSPQQALHSVYTMFFAKAQAKRLKLFISIDPHIPHLVMGDPTRLNQVTINLIGNAVKFTNEGSITVEAMQQERTGDKVKLRIAIKDTGIGIAPEKMGKIFDRFTQAESDTTRNFGGTGLGLSIASKLVELQGGKLSVNSEPGKGSEFFFTIEYQVADQQAYIPVEKTEQMASELFKGKKVLIVEDNILNQKLAQTLLQFEGFETMIAENGQKAVDVLGTQSFDIILMDIQMPILDGYEATKKIRRELNLETPIIAMTANALAGEQERCIQVGMDDYITKPFNAESLMAMIARFLKKDNNSGQTPAPAGVSAHTKYSDLSYMLEFSSGKATIVKGMIEVFLQQAPVELKGIENALAKQDFEQIRQVTHSMQTSFGFIGFPAELLASLKNVERLAKEKQDFELIREKLGVIVEGCKLAQKELEETLKTL